MPQASPCHARMILQSTLSVLMFRALALPSHRPGRHAFQWSTMMLHLYAFAFAAARVFRTSKRACSIRQQFRIPPCCAAKAVRAYLDLANARIFHSLSSLEYQRTCFLNRMTLKRSKSLSCVLRMLLCLLFANELLFHLFSTSASSHLFLSALWPIPRGISITMPVRDMYDRFAA